EEVRLTVASGATADTRISIDLWTDAAPAPPSLTLIAPDGRVFGPYRPWEKLDEFAVDQGTVSLVNDAAVDPVNRRREAYVDVGPHGDRPLASGEWRLLLDGKVGRWDAWLATVPGPVAPRFLDHRAEDMSFGGPAPTPS